MSTQQSKFKAIADKIRGHLGTTDLIKPSDFANKIDEVHAASYGTGLDDGIKQGEYAATERLNQQIAELDSEIVHLQGHLQSNMIDFAEIKSAVNTSDKEFISDNTSTGDYAEQITERIEFEFSMGETQGKQSVYDEFWDSYQSNGKRTDYSRAFEGAIWNDNRFKPKYAMYAVHNANDMFRRSNITDLSRINITYCEGAYAMCRDAANLKSFGNINLTYSQLAEGFFNCSNLVTVGTITTVASRTYVNTFVNCSKLENITFAGTIGQSLDMQYSPLSKASIESIISCLSTTATGKTLTLKKSAVNKAFETSEGAADGSTSAEWLALAGTKTNWTISLV